jgi:hypothetical protein
MGWFTTGAVTEFLAEAGEFLHAEPARNTVILSVTENLSLKSAAPPDGHAAPGRGTPDAGPGHGGQPDHHEPLFGWSRPETGATALYERLGYRPVEDRVVLTFEPRTAAAR